MKFSGQFELPSFDLKGYRRELDAYWRREIVEAARRFLGGATANIPAWSGASLGTFRDLARDAGYSLAISPKKGATNSSPTPRNVGEIKSDKRAGIYSFEYKSDLQHLVYNEFNNANLTPDPTLFSSLKRPGPYGSMAKGVAAVNRGLHKRALPRADKFIKKQQVRV